jgi:hypothetical protein
MNPKDTIDTDQYELFGKITLSDETTEIEYKEYDLEEGDWVIPLEEGITYTFDSLSNGAQFSGDNSYFFGKDVHDELQEEELTEKYSHLKELKDKYTHELDRMKTWEKLTKQQK